jgi:hypothetical protein
MGRKSSRISKHSITWATWALHSGLKGYKEKWGRPASHRERSEWYHNYYNEFINVKNHICWLSLMFKVKLLTSDDTDALVWSDSYPNFSFVRSYSICLYCTSFLEGFLFYWLLLVDGTLALAIWPVYLSLGNYFIFTASIKICGSLS